MRSRRVEPTVRSEVRARARAVAARQALERHRRIHPAFTAVYMTMFAGMGIALGWAHHVVIGGVFVGLGASLYVIVHDMSAARSQQRPTSAPAIEISGSRCQMCGAPMRIRARWPTCDFCDSTGAPTVALQHLLTRRAANAKAAARTAVTELCEARQGEVHAAACVGELVIRVVVILLVVASLIDALS